ncbi:MAG: hypothetical protein AABZ60_12130 [Planctomycetota bacterium]
MPLFEIPSASNAEIQVGKAVYKVVKIFKDDFFALTALISDTSGKKWVLKISRIKVPFLRRGFQFLLNWLGRREAKIYKYLQDISGIPKFHSAQENWFIHEYIEGDNLKEFRHVSDTFFDELLQLLQRLHQKRVVYIDLDKKDNIIVGIDKKPYLIDFQISLKFQSVQGVLGQIFKMFVKSDLYHYYKHKRSIRKDLLTEKDLKYTPKRTLPHTLHRYLISRPFRWFKRKFLPSYC